MKFLPGRMLGDTGNCTWGAWRALLLLRMKILLGRTALKTLDTMALCTARCLPPFLETTSRTVILLKKYSGCLEICRKLLDSIFRFSFLRDVATASILTPCCIIGLVSNETNEDVRMYT